MKSLRLFICIRQLVCTFVVLTCLWLQPEAIVLADDNIPRADVDIAEIYRRVRPSVVLIEARISRFEHASGAGFVIDDRGHIITNAHVIEDALNMIVVFHDESEALAELIGIDTLVDIAVIKVNVEQHFLKPVDFGDSHDLAVGQSVLAIGNPFGLEGTLTTGIISGLDRNISFKDGSTIEAAIQTDAALGRGNSGGPLLNQAGEVIGVITAGYTGQSGSTNFGFAIPSNTVQRIAERKINQKVDLSNLGIAGRDVDMKLRIGKCRPTNVPGVLVTEIAPDSPADASGLREESSFTDGRGPTYRNLINDVITAIDGNPIQGLQELEDYLSRHTYPGKEVALTFLRRRETHQVENIRIELRSDNFFLHQKPENLPSFFYSNYGFSGVDKQMRSR